VCRYAAEAWCAPSAPVAQGVLVGLGVASVGLVLYPFDVVLGRPGDRPLGKYVSAVGTARWGRWLSWLLAALVAATLIGYVAIFVNTKGKFCDAVLSPSQERAICWWTAVALMTGVAFVGLAVLRRLNRRALGKGRSGSP